MDYNLILCITTMAIIVSGKFEVIILGDLGGRGGGGEKDIIIILWNS